MRRGRGGCRGQETARRVWPGAEGGRAGETGEGTSPPGMPGLRHVWPQVETPHGRELDPDARERTRSQRGRTGAVRGEVPKASPG